MLLSEHCRQFTAETGKRVEVFCLPAGQTAHLQPFEKAAFGGVKKRWRQYIRYCRFIPGSVVSIKYHVFKPIACAQANLLRGDTIPSFLR